MNSEENTAPPKPVHWEDQYPRLGLAIDLTMVGLVVINLGWIIFDSLFEFEGVQSMLAFVFGDAFVTWYEVQIHDWFFAYDLIFVAIFLTELLAQWIYAARHKIYSHWAAYPFIHWYDVLGCIPVGSFRSLRILRIFAVLVRLQRRGIIDYTQWSLYQLFNRWYQIVLEELSDRIAVKILEGVQLELREGADLERKVIERVIMPRKQLLIDSISEKLAHTSKEIYSETQADIEAYIKQIVGEAIHQNPEISAVEKIPMLGVAVGKLLDHAVTDIVCHSLENAVENMDRPEFKRIVTEVTDAVLDTMSETPEYADAPQGGTVTDALADLVEVIKDEIRIQRWKTNSPYYL